MQTKPPRLSGSLEGLPCCSPAIQTSSPSLQPRRILGRARVQTLRQAKSDRPLHANNKCHQLYATSEGGTSSYTKRRPHWTAAKRACTTRRRRSALKTRKWPRQEPCSRPSSTSIRYDSRRRRARRRTARPTRAIGTAKMSEAEAPSTLLGRRPTCLVV